ncbi:UbiA family prenyltransferase [Flavobacterium taihuense]|uniref:UbiA family prenyltransferase n=1 Tax=Flavobacterium taihuense TaxID=2857508 RepID=A0ABS6XQD9_9FLAO|nr:UbiA family prenyltransferase [Flavobacterium taihuense]MBW4358896.1 UbiA family prenyltransferase [Flavobacterium taihuense]
MIFFKFIRLRTWWFKLPPFLVLIYLYFIKVNIEDFRREIYLILFLLAGLIIGAIFASLVNNFYDQEDDLMAGKENIMISMRKSQQLIALVITILFGISYSFFLLTNTYALVFYWLGWVCFYLYSCKQFRLKEKAYFGIIFDGLGSQFFPTLFIFAFLFGDTIIKSLAFVISGSIWMLFAFGMRSLIIHQYNDYENDIKAGVSTFVTSTSELGRSGFQTFVLLIEILSFMIFNWTIDWNIFVLPIGIYVVLLIGLNVIFKIKYYFFIPNQNQKSRSLFFDFYCTILPFTLLGLLALKNNENYLLLIVSVLLFNVPTMFNAINFFKIRPR